MCPLLLLVVACSTTSSLGEPVVGNYPHPSCPGQAVAFDACVAGGRLEDAPDQTPYEEAGRAGRGVGWVEVVDRGQHLSCEGGWGLFRSAPNVDRLEDVELFQVQHEDGHLATIGVWAPGFDPSRVPVGALVSYDYFHRDNAFASDQGHLELRGADGELLLWMTQQRALDEVEPPDGLGLTRGSVSCVEPNDCLGMVQYSELRAEFDGELVDVAPHSDASVGGYRLASGGLFEQAGVGSGQCADLAVGSVRVGLWVE